jgi:hypothetical protein
MSEISTTTERDRVATELRYVTRPYDWSENPACLEAIVGWHLSSVAAVRAETWILGTAEPLDPVSETALVRLQRYHFGRIVEKLKEENGRLKLRLLTACGCIEFYADGSVDAGARAAQALRTLLSDAPRTGEPMADSLRL